VKPISRTTINTIFSLTDAALGSHILLLSLDSVVTDLPKNILTRECQTKSIGTGKQTLLRELALLHK
jgi:hypothetical protein